MPERAIERGKTKGRLCLACSLDSACWFIHVDILRFSCFSSVYYTQGCLCFMSRGNKVSARRLKCISLSFMCLFLFFHRQTCSCLIAFLL